MIKPIVKDTFFLSQKSEPSTEKDAEVIKDLQDTLAAHREGCVGMAANMIGVKKNVIAISVGLGQFVMINPVILKKT